MEILIFVLVVFFGLGYLARNQVGPRTQRDRDRTAAGRPVGYGAAVTTPTGTTPGANAQAPFLGSDHSGQGQRSDGAE